jgi:hypothetical protein
MSEITAECDQDEVWGSVRGLVRAGSLIRDEKGLIAVVEGDDGVDVTVRGEDVTSAALIEAAAAEGGPCVLRGHLVWSGPDQTAQLSVRILGPANLNGIVRDIRRHSASGSVLSLMIDNEITRQDGVLFRARCGVTVTGADAITLSALCEGDRVTLEARDGPEGYIPISPVLISRACEPADGEGPGL